MTGRGLFLAVLAALALVANPHAPKAFVVVSDERGAELARVAVPRDGQFRLGYRNSVYGSPVEESFVAVGAGRFRLVGLAADELAVLEEYYQIHGPAEASPPGEGLAWRADPATGLVLTELRVAATDLGRRTLLMPGGDTVELWRLVDDASPTVVLRMEGG